MNTEPNVETKEHILNGLIAELERAKYTHTVMGQTWHEIGNTVAEENCAKLAAENTKAIDSLKRRLAALVAVLLFCLLLPSCSSLDRMMNPGPARASRAASGRMGAPIGIAYDEFDVMRYGIIKRQMDSMNRPTNR
jgi:hypothetical protein